MSPVSLPRVAGVGEEGRFLLRTHVFPRVSAAVFFRSLYVAKTVFEKNNNMIFPIYIKKSRIFVVGYKITKIELIIYNKII